MKARAIAAAFLASCATAGLAEPNAARLDAAISNKKYVQAADQAFGECKPYRDDAMNPMRDLTTRAHDAQQFEDCLKQMRGYVGSRTEGVSSADIRDVFQPYFSDAEYVKAKQNSEKDFMGLNLGVGLGFSRAGHSSVESATIVNNTVTVTSDKKQQARVFLETHYFIEGWCYKKAATTTLTRGCGPFLAVSATSDNVLKGVGFGWMLGWKPQDTTKQGFSVGIGAMLDNDVKDLAEGFKAGEPPPAGATTVTLEQKARWSAILFGTRTF